MSKKELIQSLVVRPYDKRKKNNMSSKSIPAHIVNHLETGRFTLEMLQELEFKFPVFYYKTCITIHGEWDIDQLPRIDGYKNVIQNENGSMEILWSAIDHEKKYRLIEIVKSVDKNWLMYKSSSDEYFSYSIPTNFRSWEADKKMMLDWVDGIRKCSFFGEADVYKVYNQISGGTNLILQVRVKAILEEKIKPLAYAMLRLDDDEAYNIALAEIEEQKNELQRQLERQRAEKEVAWKEFKLTLADMPKYEITVDSATLGIFALQTYGKNVYRIFDISEAIFDEQKQDTKYLVYCVEFDYLPSEEELIREQKWVRMEVFAKPFQTQINSGKVKLYTPHTKSKESNKQRKLKEALDSF